MALIKLDNVGVTFAVYNSKTRSIRNQIIQTVGGNVSEIDKTVFIKALTNITLDIKEGDRIGLIGHNGAGKTTLLKIFAGVYEPTEGSIKTRGKIASLTNITLGMDPEHTGYDNIIMRYILMGLTFSEAKSKIDEVIEFSELSEYIDLPMRTYSTGMYLRLAFAIATSITPDILIMDEMMSVGDASFVNKCKNRTMELINKTKIMILASHDISLINSICNRFIYLKAGKIVENSDDIAREV